MASWYNRWVKKTIELRGESIEYLLHESVRARNLRLSVDLERGLVVTNPRHLPHFFVERFMHAKSDWIIKHVAKLKVQPGIPKLKVSFHEFETNKYKALQLFKQEVDFFNSFYKFPYKGISVRNQKTLWGSCTRGGNLQFNYKLTLVPKRMRDYVIVHEICHLEEHNHGKHFWTLVSQTIPDYKQIRRAMREYAIY